MNKRASSFMKWSQKVWCKPLPERLNAAWLTGRKHFADIPDNLAP